MARSGAKRVAGRRDVFARIKVWLEGGGRYVFGFGISEILQAVGRTGSIKQAAAELGKSYRHVWARVKEAERALGQSLVEAHVGGAGTQRSFLTDTARRLVAEFLALRRRMAELVEHEFARRFGFLTEPLPPS
jgi:molybdate transport system regulatory protein